MSNRTKDLAAWTDCGTANVTSITKRGACEFGGEEQPKLQSKELFGLYVFPLPVPRNEKQIQPRATRDDFHDI